MNQHPISDLMTETMAKIKEMVDVNTIVGTPITTQDGTTVIPVSKVTFGFASGGSEFSTKKQEAAAPLAFGGGGGAGVTVSPVCFLLISPTMGTQILGVNAQANSTVDRLVEMIPGAIHKISSFVDGRRGSVPTEEEFSDE